MSKNGIIQNAFGKNITLSVTDFYFLCDIRIMLNIESDSKFEKDLKDFLNNHRPSYIYERLSKMAGSGSEKYNAMITIPDQWLNSYMPYDLLLRYQISDLLNEFSSISGYNLQICYKHISTTGYIAKDDGPGNCAKIREIKELCLIPIPVDPLYKIYLN